MENSDHKRTIKSYVLRQGHLSDSQAGAIAQLMPKWGIPFSEEIIDLNTLFGRATPKILEIGFGMGRSLVLMAQANPERNFVGIEVHIPGIAQCVYEAGTAGLSNLRVLDADAIQVLREMPDNSIDTVQLYFPDPWQKKRHFKRRFVSHDRMPLVEQKLEMGGTFHAATDWEPYAVCRCVECATHF